MLAQRLAACLAVLLVAACAKEAPPPPVAQTAPEPAPAAAPAAERNIFEFTIGSLPAFALRDGGLTLPNDGKTFAVGHPTEDVAKLLGEAGLPTGELSLSIQPLLVKAGERVLLFDTGAGTFMGPGAGKLGASLQEAGVAPASVTDIFISHSHGDHIGGLVGADGALAFPNARVHLTAAEWAFLRATKEQAALVAAITPKVDAFKPGSELVPGVVKAVEIKGHTPGHSGYLIGSGNDTLLYVGDTVHHSVISVQQPDWTIAFDTDAPTAQKSRKEVLAKYAAAGQRIYAVHFPFPGLGKFEKQGDGFVWVQAHAGDKAATADEQALLKLEREWVDAEARHDAVALQGILDDRFVATFGAGKLLDKNSFIKEVTAGAIDPTASQELSDHTIVVAGDTAVVVETDAIRSIENGRPSETVYRFTVTYIRRGDHWVALAEHGATAKR